ncbi:MAG: hypothetical protein HZB38_15920 [Planctomycetes bacterium]|nr:hypothetical protein [Planctomycetota bacterium]
MPSSIQASVATVDAPHPHCPKCDYDLTGLPEARCPECGGAFSWQDVFEQPKTIAFERAGGWARVGAFFLAWITVLAMPWVFARQAVRRCDWRWGTLFGAICFATCWLNAVPLVSKNTGSAEQIIPWTLTGAAYVILQCLVLYAFDWRNWRRPRPALLFWLAIGGYTSAIVVTEFVYAPPIVDFDSLPRLLGLVQTSSSWFSSPSVPAVHWTQIGVWLWGLACVIYARHRSAGLSWETAATLTAVSIAVLYHLYIAAIWWIGNPLCELFS